MASKHSVPADERFSTLELFEVFGVIWRNKLLVGFCAAFCLIVAAVVSFTLPPVYIATGQLVVRAESSVSSDPDHSFYSSVVNDAVVTTERDVLAARGLMERVAGTVEFPRNTSGGFGAAAHRLFLSTRTAIANLLPHTWVGVADFIRPRASNDDRGNQMSVRTDEVSRALKSSADKGSSVIALQGSSDDPAFSAAIVNATLKLYMEDRLAAQQRAASTVETALRERLQQTMAEIGRTEESIAGLVRQPGLIEDSDVPNTASELTLIGTRLSDARATLAAKNASYQQALALRQSAASDPARIVELLDQGSVATSELRRQYTQLRQELDQLSTKVGTNHPQYRAAKRSLESVVGQISAEGTRLLAQRQAEVAAAQATVDALSKQYAALRERKIEISPEVLTVDRQRGTLANLRRIAGNIEDRLIALAAIPVDPHARVLTWAQVPTRAAFPNKPLLAAMGFLVGAGLSSVGVVLAEFRRRIRPRVADQIELLPGRLLGLVPDLRRVGGSKAVLGPTFQGIAFELEAICAASNYRVLAITSGVPNEGKTTVATNLALTLSKSGKRVLLINGDLHCQADRNSGAASYNALENINRVSGTELDVLPWCGGSSVDPVAFLQSAEFANIIAVARRRYDLVLCDTPPVLSVPDAMYVARRCDAVVLVSEFPAGADRTISTEIVRRIEASGRPICGMVITKVAGEVSDYPTYLGYNAPRSPHSMLKVLASSKLK